MRLLNNLSLKLAVISLFVFILTVLFGLSIFLQLHSGDRIFDNFSEKVSSAYIESVQSNLFNFLKVPIQANASVEMTLNHLLISEKSDVLDLESPLLTTMQRVFPYSSQLSLLAFGSINGDYVGVSRETITDKFTLILKNAKTQGKLNFYSSLGLNDSVITSINHYDPRTRPWFKAVDKTKKSSWTSAYWDVDAIKGISISYSTPVYDKKGRYVGVVSSDIKLDKFNRYLQSFPNLGNGVILVVNGANNIVSHSTEETRITASKSGLANQDKVQLLSPKESNNRMIRAISPYLSDVNLEKIKFNIGEETYFVRVASFGKELGLPNWRIVVIVPQSDLISALGRDQKITIFLMLSIFIIGVTAAWIVLSRVTTPILEVAKQARQIAKLTWSPTQASRFELKEIKLLNDAFNDMSSTLSKAFFSLRHQAYYDSVTGLLSKEGLQDRMRELAVQEEIIKWKGLILVSLDNVNEVNNSLGYEKGEYLLREFVKRLILVVPENALLARVNDVEFAICYPNTFNIRIYSAEINKYTQLYVNSQECEKEHLLFSGNIGFLQNEFDDKSLTNSLRNASIALVAARKKGNGTSEVYHQDMMERAIVNTQMLTELSLAQSNNELLIHFQPIVDLRDERVIGAEALVRWQSKKYGFLSPCTFIPLAEDSGLILSIGRWVLVESCRQISLKIKSGWPTDFSIHINVSPRQLMQTDFYHLIVDTLKKYSLSAKNLTLELTESVLVEKRTIVTEQIALIRALGVSIAIDDFGSGFSSLSYLYRLQFDCLKIDKEFVGSVMESDKSEAIVSSVIRLAHGLSVPLVAEGIETKEVAERLRELGCHEGQGYYFGRPIALDEWRMPVSQVL